MTLFKSLITLVIFFGLVSSCKKDDIPKPLPDTRYPFTYSILTQTEWDNLNTKFLKINNHDSLYLNEFGFVQGKLFLDSTATIDAELVIEQTQALLNNYRDFMGIPGNVEINTPEDLTAIDYMMSPYGYTDVYNFFSLVVPSYIGLREMYAEMYGYTYEPEPFTHYFFLRQDEIGKTKLTSTEISLLFHESNNSMEIFGNWYPEVFVPSSQIYSEEEALKIASQVYSNEVDKKLWRSESDQFQVSTERVIVPVKSETKIELHECWKFLAVSWETLYIYNINVDTQTGEVISNWISHVEY